MVNVFITIDTEHSIGGAFRDPRLKPVGNEKRIFGKIGNKYYGIPLIMDIADEYGIPLTFFVEVMNKYYFGPDETRRVVEYILKRGHDVQLHVHPNYLNFTLKDPSDLKFSDLIGDYDLDRQVEIIEEAIDTLVDYGAPIPRAFRAGCFGANEDTLRALKRNGFLIDSSYNASYLGGPCLFEPMDINDATRLHGIIELPITNFREHSYIRAPRLMPLDINGVSFREIRYVLEKANKFKLRSATILLHSFSFIAPGDVQYGGARPRRIVIDRFEELCQFLATNTAAFQPSFFAQLARNTARLSLDTEDASSYPTMPSVLSIMRGLEQLADRVL